MKGQGRTGVGVRASLEAVARSARRLLVIERVARVGAWAVGAVVAIAVLDYLVHLPWGIRLVALLGGLVALGRALWLRVWPAVRLRIGATDIALRVEDLPECAGARGLLASGVEFSQSPAPSPLAARMRAEVVRRAEEAMATVRPWRVLRTRGVARALGAFALMAGVVGAAWAVRPTLTEIGARRVLTPWAGAAWPRRTEVEDATGLTVHALGSALPLRAHLVRTDREPGQTPVWARYRVVRDGRAGPVRRVQLSAQRRLGVGGPEVYERLIEPAVLAGGASGEGVEVVYWFETADDRTDEARVRLVEPPAVARVTAVIEPPAYVRGPVEPFASGTIDLGDGLDERGVVRSVLRGSRVRVEIEWNKAIAFPEPASGNTERLRRAVESADRQALVEAHAEATRSVLSWVASSSVRLPVEVYDQYGLGNAEEAVIALDVVEDAPASAAVVEPPEDERVLPRAVIGVIGRGHDDTGLAWVSLVRRVARAPGGSGGAAPEPAEAGVEMERVASAGGAREMSVAATLDLSDLGVGPGDEVWLTARAQDAFELDGAVHEAAESEVRRLMVVSEEEFVERIRAELAGVRDAARRADEEQQRLIERVRDGGADEATAARQAAVGERVGRMQEAVGEQMDRAARNRLDDPELEDLLRRVEGLAGRAAVASRRASASLESRAGEEPLSPAERDAALEAQEEVRDALGRMLEELDRGEDAWLAQRNLDRLIDQQRRLERQTREATAETIGRPVEDLSQQERDLLEAIAQRQSDLAERARRLLDEMRAQGDRMDERSAAQAEAMRQAAQRGSEAQVPQRMDQAARAARENLGQQAQDLQRQAREALEAMREELDEAERNRDAVLRRVLADLIESIAALVVRQEEAIGALVGARTTGDFAGLDEGMIRLHRNTLGVADRASGGFSETQGLAGMLGSAAQAQSEAIGALRAVVVDDERAERYERQSHAALLRALEEARRLDEEARQRQIERQRRELLRSYREALALQVGLRDDTATLAGQEASRRQRAMVRRLGERQSAIRSVLDQAADGAGALEQANVAQMAHRRLDALAGRAEELLRAGTADANVLAAQDGVIALLRAMVDSLDERSDGAEQDFAEGSGQGQSGQQQGEEVFPALAELRLLKAMQQQAYEMTRALDEAGTMDAADVEALGDLQRELAVEGARLLERVQEEAQRGREGGGG